MTGGGTVGAGGTTGAPAGGVSSGGNLASNGGAFTGGMSSGGLSSAGGATGGTPGAAAGGTTSGGAGMGGAGAATTDGTGALPGTGGEPAGGGPPSSGGASEGSAGIPNGSGGLSEGAGGAAAGGDAAGGSNAAGGSGGTSGGGASGAENLGGASSGGAATDPDARHLLLRDEGNTQLHYVSLQNPAENWHVAIPSGRDLQLVGDGRVLIGTENGYEERDIATGAKLDELTSYPGTITARRLRNRNTLLVGADWQNRNGVVLVEVDAGGAVTRTINYPAFSYVRLVRQTPTDSFLITSDRIVFEGNVAGDVLWQVTVTHNEPHSWMAVRLASGDTAVSTGYGASLQVFSPAQALVRTITGPGHVTPSFYAGFQVLANGNYVVTNWQGHGTGLGNSGVQVLEYAPDGTLVWSWQQDPSYVSSLQGVIVLNGLDLDRLHVEGPTGALEPVD